MADTAETVKKTADQATAAATSAAAKAKAQAETFQAAGANAFREGIDKSVASMGELNAHGKKNLDALVESAAVAQKGAEALSQQAMGFAKEMRQLRIIELNRRESYGGSVAFANQEGRAEVHLSLPAALVATP